LLDRLHDWLHAATQRAASDIHLIAGYPPTLRLHGQLVPLEGEPPLQAAFLEQLLPQFVRADVQEQLSQNHNVDFAYQMGRGTTSRRFRVNAFWHQRLLGFCFRIIPDAIPDLNWTQFPSKTAEKLLQFRSGLVLISGATGTGKSTTLAMLVQEWNRMGHFRIITVEDPIEYVFPLADGSLITQRGLGEDVASFADGLKYGLRQDPDIILVGEIRDPETARMASNASETGHLVLSTVHGNDAKGAISRLIDLFPISNQQEIRAQLSNCLKAIVCQQLLPSSLVGERRELAVEVLYNSAPIAASIRQGKLEAIDNYILTGRQEGMISMADSIKRLLADGKITRETADQFLVWT
jgi:twitching motility protein PilT